MNEAKIDLSEMITEMRNPSTMELDTMSSLEIVSEMNREDALIPQAIRPHLEKIAQIADLGCACLKAGGRIFYLGAGTSGRLGVLDASECPPTFGVPGDRVIGLIAGGGKAVTEAVEGAEDDPALAEADLKRHSLTAQDLVIGLSASGRTPYVLGGLAYAQHIGCHTAAVSCNRDAALSRAAQIYVEVITGPEILTGSTRLKAGTAQKMILNMISTAAMIGTGKAYRNLMVDVMLTNDKLRSRAVHIVMEATGADARAAEDALLQAGGHCKTAIVMLLAGCGKEEANLRLEAAGGHVREALFSQA